MPQVSGGARDPHAEAAARADRGVAGPLAQRPDAGGTGPMLGLTQQLSNYLTLKGSFSAVSKPHFASKYAFESSRRDLHNAFLCTTLLSQNIL